MNFGSVEKLPVNCFGIVLSGRKNWIYGQSLSLTITRNDWDLVITVKAVNLVNASEWWDEVEEVLSPLTANDHIHDIELHTAYRIDALPPFRNEVVYKASVVLDCSI